MHTEIVNESYEVTLPSGSTYRALLDVEAASTVEGLEGCVTIAPLEKPSATDSPVLNAWLLEIGCHIAKYRGRKIIVTLDNNGRTELWSCNPNGTRGLLMREK
jgi:hypothetical protein